MNNRFSFFLFLIVFFVGQQTCCAQSGSVQQMIDSALGRNQQLTLIQAQTQTLAKEKMSINLLDEVEIRTEVTDFTDPRREYTARMRMNGMAQQDATRALNRARIDALGVEASKIRFDLLLKVYQDALDWASCQADVAILEKERTILEDKKTVVSKKIQLGDTEAFKSLFRLELDLEELQIKTADCQSRMQQYRTGYGMDSLNTQNWFATERLLVRMLNTLDISSENPIAAEQAHEQRMIELEQNLETAEGKQTLDFLQIRYRNPDNNGFQEGASVGFSFRLPYNGQSKSKQFELKVEALELERERLEAEAGMLSKLREIQSEAQFLLEKRNQLLDLQRQHQSNTTFQKILTDVQTDPLTRLDLVAMSLEKEKRLLDLNEDVYELYLEWLEWTGKIMEQKSSSWLEE